MEEPAGRRARAGDPFLAATLCAAALGLVLTVLGILWVSRWKPGEVVSPVPDSALLGAAILAAEMAVFRVVMRCRSVGEASGDLAA